MRNFLTWFAILLCGLALGLGGAVWSLRTSTFGNDIRSGPWTTGRAIGTAEAGIRTRAIVALRGLLALPASEARYFTARTDSAGRPLDGRCAYTVNVGTMPSRWWSITAYDPAGWLIPNRYARHSAGTNNLVSSRQGWRIELDHYADNPDYRDQLPINGIPTPRTGPFELTLRLYRFDEQFWRIGLRRALPTIERGRCTQ